MAPRAVTLETVAPSRTDPVRSAPSSLADERSAPVKSQCRNDAYAQFAPVSREPAKLQPSRLRRDRSRLQRSRPLRSSLRWPPWSARNSRAAPSLFGTASVPSLALRVMCLTDPQSCEDLLFFDRPPHRSFTDTPSSAYQVCLSFS